MPAQWYAKYKMFMGDMRPMIKYMARTTYAPYTQRALKQGMAIVNTDQLPDQVSSALYVDRFSSQPIEFQVNDKAQGAYRLSCDIERAAIHYAQLTSNLMLSPLQAGIDDYTTMSLVQQMQQEGNTLYKLVRDFCDGGKHAPDLNAATEFSNPYLVKFIEAHQGTKAAATTSHQEKVFVAKGLEDIRRNGEVKPLHEILPAFYYQLSCNAPLVSFMVVSAAFQQRAIHDFFTSDEQTQREALAEIFATTKADALFSAKFTEQHVVRLLGMDGFDYRSELGAEKSAQFWQNLNKRPSGYHAKLHDTGRYASYINKAYQYHISG